MKKRKKIFLLVVLANIGLLIAFIIGVGEKPPMAIWTTDEGVEYKIMAIGQLYLHAESERMLTVRYLSMNPADAQIRQVEYQDMYTMIGQKLKLDDFGSVGLEAVDKPPRVFGITSSSSYRDSKPVDEVLKLVDPNGGTSEQGEQWEQGNNGGEQWGAEQWDKWGASK